MFVSLLQNPNEELKKEEKEEKKRGEGAKNKSVSVKDGQGTHIDR